MKKFLKAPSPAMIVAMVALVVAMGGSAYAGIKIGTKQIKNGAVTQSKLANPVKKGVEGAYASIDGFGPTVQSPYKRNVGAVTRIGTGSYCLEIKWAAAGRTPEPQATPVIASARNSDQIASADVYSCPNNGVSVVLENRDSGAAVDGWVHVLVP